MQPCGLFFALLIFLALVPAPLRADELYKFAQITCSPRLHYFSVRVVPIYNLPSHGRYRDAGLDPSARSTRALEQEVSFFDVDSLTDRPLRCVLPGSPELQGAKEAEPQTTVQVVGHRLYKYDEKTGQDLINITTASVIVDGGEVAQFDLGVFGSRDVSSVEIEQDGVGLVARICRAQNGDPAPLAGGIDTLQCLTTSLGQNARSPRNP